MYLEQIAIKNFRGISSCELDFEKDINLIIGENGTGKTSILEAIAVGLGGFVSGLDGVASRNFTQDEIQTVFSKTGDGSYNSKHILPIEVSCVAKLHDETFEWKRAREAFRSSRTGLQPRQIAKAASELAGSDDSIMPIISYQSASRTWMQKKDTKSAVTYSSSRVMGYSDCLYDVSSRKQILNWCAKMEQVSWQKEKPIGEYEGAKAAVAKFMSTVDGQDCSLYYEKQSESLLYIRNNKAEAISTLSAGYQSLIWMVFDIAYRMALLNPDLREDICQTPGIVLVDEIDIHLHPEWQWAVINALKTVFPNVQLIVATHSPIVIASIKQGRLIDINNMDDISYVDARYGLDVNDTLNQIQNVLDKPAEVVRLQKEFDEAINSEDLRTAREKAEELEVLVGPNRPVSVEVRTTYELEAALAEE